MNKAVNTSLAVSLLAASATAFSADVTAPVATELPMMTVQDSADGEYVVPNATTGTKTDTPLMDTPMSIYVVPQQVLQDQQALTLDRALSNVPGVNSGGGQGGQESITLRGFFTTTTFTNGFRVEEYSTTGGGTTGAMSLTNIDHVEVLLGPAAILYGRVEPGGMVNIITKQPEAQFSAAVQQQLGSWGHSVTSLDVTGSVNSSGTLQYRVNASYDTANSWRDTITSRVSFLAPVLKWTINPQTNLTIEGELRRSVLNQDVGQIVPLDPGTNQLVWTPRNQTFLLNPITYDTSRIFETLTHAFSPDWSVTQKFMHSLTVVPVDSSYYPSYMPGPSGTSGLYLVGDTWYADRMLSVNGSSNKTDAGIVDLVGHLATRGIRHTLLLGGDIYRTLVQFTGGGSAAVSTTTVVNPTPPSLVADPAFGYLYQVISNNFGIYFQDQVVVTDALQLVIGERYQHLTPSSGFAAPLGTPLVSSPAPSDSAFTPHAGLLWHPQKWLSLYASYATNFGSNNGVDWQGMPLDPESGRQYELGAKAELLDGRLTSTFAWFDLTKTNVAVGDPVHPGYSVTIGQVRSRGVEYALQGELRPGWQVMANVSYDPTLITAGGPPGSGFVTGDPLPGTPDYMVNIWTTYRLPQPALAGWKIGAGANWRDSSSYPGATNAGTALTTPAYWVLSAMASYERRVGKSRLTLQLNVDNLANSFYYYGLYPAAYANYSYLNYGTPRSVLASVRLDL
jgi:iron complex outermembrane receptor protein